MTRGLLVLLNSEDELAGVVGHEMAHVLERHAARRVSAATPFAVIFGVPAAILGSVSPTLGGIVSGTGRLASSVALASYSRDQEREADQRGIVLVARAGYDPTALATFLRTLEREEELAGQNPDRAALLRVAPRDARARGQRRDGRPPQPRAPGTPIAGQPHRRSWAGSKGWWSVTIRPPDVFLGSLFVQPDLDVALTMPAGWKTINTPEVAAAVAPDGDAAVLLNLVGPGDDPVAGAKADGAPRRADEAGAAPADRGAAGRPPDRRHARERSGHADLDRAPQAHLPSDRHDAAAATGSTTVPPSSGRPPASGRSPPADRERIVESRLRLRLATAGETVAQVLARGGGTWNAARTAVANGTTVAARLDAGWPVKVPVAQRYGG